MFTLSKKNSLANHFLAELRDVKIQKDSLRFRRNLERIGEIMAYEISSDLSFESERVITPLGSKNIPLIEDKIVLATILRAGLPFHQGFLNYFDNAENAFIGAYRGRHKDDHSFEIVQQYMGSPSLDGKTLILIDPMLATGKSIVSVYKALLDYGHPSKCYIASVIASQAGVDYIQNELPDAMVYVGDVDEELNNQFYIVPGLGDAGDLAFGQKIGD